MKIREVLLKAVIIFLIFTVLCGVLYTALVMGISQLFFRDKANGSIFEVNGQQYTTMLGQNFSDKKHMWGRVTIPGTVSFEKQGGALLLYGAPSNISPASEGYGEEIEKRVQKIKAAHPEMGDMPVPVDLVTNSGSGMDPEISAAAAAYQVKRLARENNMTEEKVKSIIQECTIKRLFGTLGEERVNVVKVNMVLDGILVRP